MSEEELKRVNSPSTAEEASLSNSVDGNSEIKIKDKTSVKPTNQLECGLLGWYAACSSQALQQGKTHNFSMYNEPLILYRDKDNLARCIKDLCPHRGASFMGGDIKDGELVCPYHGARFSSKGECTNLDRITCQHIVDTN